jgi:glycosyltransferase involved in cell wall biosynthesis
LARLYREAVAAVRAKDAVANSRRFRLLSTAWRVKLAMVRQVLIIHRYKEQNDPLLAPELEGRPSFRTLDGAGFRAPGDVERDRGGPEGALPTWMIDDFKALARNEPSLWPHRDFLSRFVCYKPRLNTAPGSLYFRLYALLTSAKVDVVVLCPWLKRGGADKGVLQFVEYYAKRGKVALITTSDADSPWLNKAPAGVQTVEFGKLAGDLSEDEKVAVLTRLLLELAPRLIHTVQSDLGWRCVCRHGTALRSNGAALVGSVFSEEVGADGRRFGYAIAYLPKARDFIDVILTDNAPYCDTLRRRYHLAAQRVRRVPFWRAIEPASAGIVSPSPSPPTASVLWAGRLGHEKRPDLLFAVAQTCKDLEFHLFGQADETKFAAKWRRKLAALPNVRLYGAYEDFHSVVARQAYRAFLYLTAFDGLPHVLLEVASHRIPIVAPPAIGGLADLIGLDTAFPVDDADDAASYVSALRGCLADSAEAARRAQNAFDAVRVNHSHQAFEAAMDEVFSELGDARPG